VNGLPYLLLTLVTVRHYGADFLALLYEHPEAARRALFYVLGGIEGAVLFAVVWSLCPRRPQWLRLSVAMTCAWGFLEESQVAVCRLARGIEQPASAPMWQGICDSFTGWPVTIGTLLLVLVVAIMWRPEWTSRRK
jgi:hypothetical protein